MIFGPYGQTLLGRVHGRTFGHGPGYQNSIDRQTDVIVLATGSVFLNDKDTPLAVSARSACRLRRFGELSLKAIIFEWHSSHSSVCRVLPDTNVWQQYLHRMDGLYVTDIYAITLQPSRRTRSKPSSCLWHIMTCRALTSVISPKCSWDSIWCDTPPGSADN